MRLNLCCTQSYTDGVILTSVHSGTSLKLRCYEGENRHNAHNIKAKVFCYNNFTISCFNIFSQILDYAKYIDVGWSHKSDMLPCWSIFGTKYAGTGIMRLCFAASIVHIVGLWICAAM